MSKGGRNDYPGSNNSSLGTAGRVAELVCLTLSGPQPNQDWQDATNANCARLGRDVDKMVGNDRDNNSSSNSTMDEGWAHLLGEYKTYNPDSAANNHQD